MWQPDHPWLATTSTPAPAVPPALDVLTGAVAPQPGVVSPDAADRLPRRAVTQVAPIWWVGAHGGAGETTMSHLFADSRAADHGWPLSDGRESNTVLVARSSASGLSAAQRAAADWASGALPGIRLVGLVVIADAPGRLPRDLDSLIHRIGGGVPRMWRVPWVERWRLGEPVELESAPSSVRSAILEIGRHSVVVY